MRLPDSSLRPAKALRCMHTVNCPPAAPAYPSRLTYLPAVPAMPGVPSVQFHQEAGVNSFTDLSKLLEEAPKALLDSLRQSAVVRHTGKPGAQSRP